MFIELNDEPGLTVCNKEQNYKLDQMVTARDLPPKKDLYKL